MNCMEKEVHSWRDSANLETGLEREPQHSKLTLQQSALKCLGVLDGGNPHRSETVLQDVRQRLNQRYHTRCPDRYRHISRVIQPQYELASNATENSKLS